MSGRVTDDGLSEVIGFILIIGLLVVVLSLYITYVVPSEGRTNEINQMDYIKQQFLDYKLNTDALWLNNQIGASITQALTMGTAGETTTGMFGGFSLVSPVGSGGSVLVNPMERSERMHITVAGVTQNDPAVFTVVDAPIIDGISPRFLTVGTAGTVHIYGSGFQPDGTDVEVFMKGSKVETGVSVIDNNEITVAVPAQTGPGIIHIYVKKPQRVRSNEAYLMINQGGDNDVPEITGFSVGGSIQDFYIANSGIPISIQTNTPIGGNTLVFVNNVLTSSAGDPNINVGNAAQYFTRPNVVPVTIVNPQPGGGSSTRKLFILPASGVDSPEIWGISPDHGSSGSDLVGDLNIYGAGFTGAHVYINNNEITSGISIPTSNHIIVDAAVFSALTEPGTYSIIVKNGGKSSGSVQKKSGFLTPPKLDYPNSDPIQHFYVNFTNTGYVTNQTHALLTMGDISNFRYGVDLTDENNDLNIKLEAVPRIISSDWDITADPIPTPNPSHPELDKYYISYQTDLVLNISKGNTKIMDNYVIQSDITSGNTIWLDLLNPAYGISEYIKVPFSFIVENIVGSTPVIGGAPDPSSSYLTVGYTLLSNSIIENSTVIADNAIGGLEYRSKNYYYRTQQNFVYQSGGVFVEQADGSNPLVLPSISISSKGKEYLVVGIANIPMTGYDNVAGSSEVQVSTSLDSVQNYDTSLGIPNAKSVILHIDPTTPTNRARWYAALKAICESARNNGVPVAFSKSDSNYADAWVRMEKDDEDNPPILNIRGPDHENLGAGFKNRQDIILNLKTPELAVSLNPVGKAVSIR